MTGGDVQLARAHRHPRHADTVAAAWLRARPDAFAPFFKNSKNPTASPAPHSTPRRGHVADPFLPTRTRSASQPITHPLVHISRRRCRRRRAELIDLPAVPVASIPVAPCCVRRACLSSRGRNVAPRQIRRPGFAATCSLPPRVCKPTCSANILRPVIRKGVFTS